MESEDKHMQLAKKKNDKYMHTNQPYQPYKWISSNYLSNFVDLPHFFLPFLSVNYHSSSTPLYLTHRPVVVVVLSLSWKTLYILFYSAGIVWGPSHPPFKPYLTQTPFTFTHTIALSFSLFLNSSSLALPTTTSMADSDHSFHDSSVDSRGMNIPWINIQLLYYMMMMTLLISFLRNRVF